MESTLAPQTGRLDRHVRRSYLRLGEGASRHRICYSLEEALRLTNLPGEEEGRIYCFRRVSLSGISGEANRRVWTERVQHALGAIAARAVHASHPSAGATDAVYFNNLEEAIETLLSKALRAPSVAAWARPEWFSTSLLGLEAGTSYSRQIPAIVERLRPPAFAPGTAAAILFAALGDADPAGLLSAIPTGTLREWMRSLEGPTNATGDVPPVQLPQRLRTALERAAEQFGWKDPGAVWLAVQAVLCLSPSAWMSGTAVKRARATLRMLEADQRHNEPDRSASMIRDIRSGALVFDDDEIGPVRGQPRDRVQRHSLYTERVSLPEIRSANLVQQDETNLPSLQLTDGKSSVPEPTPAPQVLPPATSLADGLGAKPALLGSATQAAGLFFLLNAMQRAGIAAALDACPELAEAGLAAHILKRLASHAAVADDDPILLCLRSPQEQFTIDSEVLAALPRKFKVWPLGFTPSFHSGFDSEYFLRIWVLAVRRWCWRAGRLPLREIVQRNGRIWQTRTDIDVTLPLAAADIRIRRIGLDIDPGWLPWFGVHGRVVRFHYRDREPGGNTC